MIRYTDTTFVRLTPHDLRTGNPARTGPAWPWPYSTILIYSIISLTTITHMASLDSLLHTEDDHAHPVEPQQEATDSSSGQGNALQRLLIGSRSRSEAFFSTVLDPRTTKLSNDDSGGDAPVTPATRTDTLSVAPQDLTSERWLRTLGEAIQRGEPLRGLLYRGLTPSRCWFHGSFPASDKYGDCPDYCDGSDLTIAAQFLSCLQQSSRKDGSHDRRSFNSPPNCEYFRRFACLDDDSKREALVSTAERLWDQLSAINKDTRNKAGRGRGNPTQMINELFAAPAPSVAQSSLRPLVPTPIDARLP